jgi:O-antigen ligase
VNKLLLGGLFTFFLYPLSVDGVSINYTFVLAPLACLLVGRPLRRPPTLLLMLAAWYAIVFVIASVYQYDLHAEAMRRVVSFIIFMTIFSYACMKLEAEHVEAFKTALVMVSLIMSIASVLLFLSLGGSALGFAAKDLVGTQRFGFIYIMAIWVMYFFVPSGWSQRLFRYGCIALILIGLLLTFSRSSVIALAGVIGFFALAKSLRWVRAPTLKSTVTGMVAVLGVAVLAVTIVTAFPVTYEFFESRIVEFAMDPGAVSEDLEEEGSAGTRLVILRRVAEYVGSNPITGSGYLGVWTLFQGFAGSAHNQYADVLFRTGIVGFVGYCCLLFAIGRYLRRNCEDLFWGFLGVLFYGLFHETFKESHGGFLLAFLVGMTAQALRRPTQHRTVRRAAAHPVPPWAGPQPGIVTARE